MVGRKSCCGRGAGLEGNRSGRLSEQSVGLIRARTEGRGEHDRG
jgi:hypothetical protein